MGVGGQLHAPAALTSVTNRYPLYRRQGGHQGLSGRVGKISPPPGFDPRAVPFFYCVRLKASLMLNLKSNFRYLDLKYALRFKKNT